MPYVPTLDPMVIPNVKKFDPQRTNNFEVVINLAKIGLSADEIKSITLSVSEFSLPNIQTNPIEIGIGNSKVKFAGQVEFGGADSLVIVDYIGSDIEKLIVKWHKKVYDPETGKIGFAQDYKTSATVYEFSPDGSIVREWVLEGVFPTGIDYGSGLSKDSADVKKITITLSYDRAYRKI